MLTIFSCPKPFHGHLNIIQRNAIKSWILLQPEPEIIIIGDEEGTAEICKEFGMRHIPKVERNDYGTPLMSSIFSLAEKAAKYRFMCYVNADIILKSDFIIAIEKVMRQMSRCLIVGRRWNMDIKEEIDFSEGWEDKLKFLTESSGQLFDSWGIDYFVFPKGIFKMLPFAVGRVMWDNWFIYKARSLRIPVIDITPVVTVVHQNHDHKYNNRYGDYRKGKEAKRNLALAGGYGCSFSINNATYRLTRSGLEKNLSFPRFYCEANRFIRRGLKAFIK